MKKVSTLLAICLLGAKLASAQVLPSFQFGAKAGVKPIAIIANSYF
jgi:hypothetical protein